jgi:hypothetical protein
MLTASGSGKDLPIAPNDTQYAALQKAGLLSELAPPVNIRVQQGTDALAILPAPSGRFAVDPRLGLASYEKQLLQPVMKSVGLDLLVLYFDCFVSLCAESHAHGVWDSPA